MVYTSKSRPIYSKEGGGGIAIDEDCCKCGPDCLCTFQKVSWPITATWTCPKDPDPDEYNVSIGFVEEEDWETALPPEDICPREDICQVGAGRWVPSVLDCADPDITGVDLVIVWRRTGTDPKHVSLYWKVDDTAGEGGWFSTGADEALSECDPLPPCLVFSDVTVPGCCDPEDMVLKLCPKDNECPEGQPILVDVVLYKEKEEPDIYNRYEEVDRKTLELKDDGVPGIPRSASWTWDIEGQTVGPYHVRFSCQPGEACSSWDLWNRLEGDLSWLTATLGGCAGPPGNTGCCGDPIQGHWGITQDDIPPGYVHAGEMGEAWERCGCFTAMDQEVGNPIAYGILPDGSTVDFPILILGQAGNPGSVEGEFCETLRVIMDLNALGCPHISQVDLGVYGCGNIDGDLGPADIPVEWLPETWEEAPGNRCFGTFDSNVGGHNLPEGCDHEPNTSRDTLEIGTAPEQCQNCPEWLTIAVHWRERGLGCAVDYRPDSAGVGSALASKIAKLSWMFPSLRKTEGCDCKREERRLNRLGPANIRANLESELDRLQGRAEREDRAFNRTLAKIILLKCCREVESRQ